MQETWDMIKIFFAPQGNGKIEMNFLGNHGSNPNCSFCLTREKLRCSVFWIYLVDVYGVGHTSSEQVEVVVEADVLSSDEESSLDTTIKRKEKGI